MRARGRGREMGAGLEARDPGGSLVGPAAAGDLIVYHTQEGLAVLQLRVCSHLRHGRRGVGDVMGFVRVREVPLSRFACGPAPMQSRAAP